MRRLDFWREGLTQRGQQILRVAQRRLEQAFQRAELRRDAHVKVGLRRHFRFHGVIARHAVAYYGLHDLQRFGVVAE